MLLKMLFILFVGLKLTNFIDWSWWLVCVPIMLLVLKFIVVSIIIDGITSKKDWAIRLAKWIKS